ncbi:MAG: UDP-N-acetylmuramoyl-L-alanine--D-glutamate ligase [Pseudomonadota bacterium]
MIDLFYFGGYPVAVLGLGRSGLSAAKALVQCGAEVSAWDDDPAKREAAAAAGIPIAELTAVDWRQMTTLVISPGIPHDQPAPHPVAALARAGNCEIIGDIELLARAQRDAGYIGITGTNGKSTTTSLIGHVLETAGRDVEVGGNLGIPVLELAGLDSTGSYVLEMSSYQLEITFSITFDVAVLLNISPDHLERHGGFEGYVKAKREIFRRQTKPRTAVIGTDDETCRAIFEELRQADEQNVIPISGNTAVAGGVFQQNGILIDDLEGQAAPVLSLADVPSLPGIHNAQNAAAAYAVCKTMGVQPPVIAACISSFPGLSHRQEVIAVVDGIVYINDSKATNAEAAKRALACYGRIYWIAGGRAKDGGLDGVEPLLSRVAKAFLIGEAEGAFADQLDGKVALSRCGDLASALEEARAAAMNDAEADRVVLLSPAAASFDQFSDFEARGEAFRALVEALPGRHEDLGPGGRVLQ